MMFNLQLFVLASLAVVAFTTTTTTTSTVVAAAASSNQLRGAADTSLINGITRHLEDVQCACPSQESPWDRTDHPLMCDTCPPCGEECWKPVDNNNRQLEVDTDAIYTPATTGSSDTAPSSGGAISSSASSNGSGTTTNPCPVEITLDSEGETTVGNGDCSGYLDGKCAYQKNNQYYAHCTCVQTRTSGTAWGCFPGPAKDDDSMSTDSPTYFPTSSPAHIIYD
mmetsp:Transcript_13157/g.14746  ORF Transcript_13157/g.14746 Transcript_13157/m.14746 type:complete len:224 (+) Transcript_13157:102-773(+)|eukprot:CAMPEP_0170851656 /NCGR_PEP_ID=MMETSP0734-20130129/11375_1 /TAXON_ID=186038 /ORGANISM="Fragilariopsis kerguelensis, Strain L26-C5" /LENGTH=223 /DNA_ID=CAMNT_0011221841 /DNA_START=99 /DNA_END=770 /DNA_ORIENTATION=-